MELYTVRRNMRLLGKNMSLMFLAFQALKGRLHYNDAIFDQIDKKAILASKYLARIERQIKKYEKNSTKKP